MYIKNKPAAAFYKLSIGIISLAFYLYFFGNYGIDALRLFPTWVLFIAAWYYLGSSLGLALNKSRHYNGKNPCPMLEGMIIVAFFSMLILNVASWVFPFDVPILKNSFDLLIPSLLLLLTLLDWILFVKKGRWRPMMPFYWLALPLCYIATMIFTAELLPSSTNFLYPLAFFNYTEYGLVEFFLWLLIIVLVVLANGYTLYLIDFAASGRLAKKIVLPHIRTVVIDEPTQPDVPVKEPEVSQNPPRPKNKPVEIINMTPKSEKPKSHKSNQSSSKSQNSSSRKPPQSKKSASPKSRPKSKNNSNKSGNHHKSKRK